ncbi:sulfatase [Cytophaga sp. FL35]|uniref:sulfatase family protein n=1 Tax=Cytophaga sp. FL35 TaxID=1904456 RepID=UPI001653DC23|nr:sulfatase [Cytophaga sp. FL35]MBC6999627.1 sulfatase [Cytophaga sp. FL35]
MKIHNFIKLSSVCLVFYNIIQSSYSQSKVKPNIIVFMADDVSYNDLGCYGNSFVKTPNIDGLAKKGIRFDNAILTTSSCSPSRISILTGRYPHNTGAAELHTEPKKDFSSIASELQKKGYYTGQAGKWHMGKLLRQGFDSIYDENVQNGDGGEAMWMPTIKQRDKNKPFFFWFAAFDAHRPWGQNRFSKTHKIQDVEVPSTLVDDKETREDLTHYYNEIARFDAYIGKVVATLKAEGEYENTLILIMADNGRPFPRDKTRMYDSGIKTPFIAHWSGRLKEGISTSLVSAVDVAPTLLDVCEVETPRSFQGKSFKKLFKDPNLEFRKYAFAEHNWHDHEAHERMVRTKDFLYVLNFRPQFPNQGPADALNSTSFKSLQRSRANGNLTAEQNDVFLQPRPMEELFELSMDEHQYYNLSGKNEFEETRRTLKKVLENWMLETADSVPDDLTKDWYTRDSGKKMEENFKVRGEMPGCNSNADEVNSGGPF